MTAPTYPTHSKNGQRIYNGQKGLVDVPGVTSICNNIDKSGLGYGRARESAKTALADLPTLVGWAIDGKEKAFLNHVSGAATRKWGDAAETGTEVHAIVEKYLLGEALGVLSPKHQGFMTQFEIFVKDWEVEPLDSGGQPCVEVTVWNETIGYAGTADAFAMVGGEPICLDTKTGESGVWPETALQLAAYCNAEFIIEADGTQRELPKTEGAAALHLRPDFYKVVPIRVDDEVFDVFRHLVHVANWQRTVSKSVLGAPAQAQASGGTN